MPYTLIPTLTFHCFEGIPLGHQPEYELTRINIQAYTIEGLVMSLLMKIEVTMLIQDHDNLQSTLS